MTFRHILPAAVPALLLAAGCATWDCRFNARATSTFVNEANESVTVDFAPEKRTTKLPLEDGSIMPYKSQYKARVTFPNGYRFVAYNVPSSDGATVYRSDDGEWELYTVGYACRVTEFFPDGGAEIVYEGVVASQKGSMSEGPRSRGERVYSSPREHGNDGNRASTPQDRAGGRKGAK